MWSTKLGAAVRRTQDKALSLAKQAKEKGVSVSSGLYEKAKLHGSEFVAGYKAGFDDDPEGFQDPEETQG